VSVVDATTPASNPATIFVGPHPSALALSGSDLYVALAGANRVARVDLRTGSVAEQVTLELAPQAPTGSDPNALAVTADGRSVYVALAGANAIAVLHRSRTGLRVAGFIPAGWYPTAVTLSADGRTLFVANGKGGGSHANPDGRYIGAVITGSVAIVPVPDSAALARYTRQVYALSPYSNPRVRSIPPHRQDPLPPSTTSCTSCARTAPTIRCLAM
jgi:DNA-binding beta-propeller fold protein YncE